MFHSGVQILFQISHTVINRSGSGLCDKLWKLSTIEGSFQ